jgi:iron complex outermembrane receptor protein
MASASALAQTTPANTVPAPAAPAEEETISLSEFVVSSEKATGYRATNAITATGIGTMISETPLAINIVTSELIGDTASFDLRESLNLVPGVLTNPRSESAFTVRGFGGNITYRNGQYRRQLLTTWNIDQVEVVKGPAAIFFGAVRPGGIINYVTKKPVLTSTFTDLKLMTGSDEYYSGELQHNQVLNSKLAMRVGIGGISAGGDRQFQYKHESYGGLSFLWKPTSNQQITVDAEILNREQYYLNAFGGRILSNSRYLFNPTAVADVNGSDNRYNKTIAAANSTRNWLNNNGYAAVPTFDIYAPVYGNGDPLGYSVALAHDARQKNESKTVDFDYLLKLRDNLVFQSTWNYGFDDAYGLQPADGDTRVFADGTMRFRVEEFINVRHSHMIHNKLTYRFEVLKMKHTVQLGQDFQYVRFTRPGYLNSANQYNDSPGNTGSAASNPYIINYRPGVSAPVSLASIIAASGQGFNIIRERWEENYGYFLVDQIEMFDSRLFLMGGARYNLFTGDIKYTRPVSNSSLSARSPGGLINYDVVGSKGGWTPQFGALGKILPSLSLFGTYSNSIEPNFSLDADGVSSEPVESTSWDIGLKTDLFASRLTGTLAYYDINRTNLAYRDSAREAATGRSPYFIFGNEEASEGVELDINWSPTDSYQLVAGWSHIMKAEVTKSNVASSVGRRFGYIPENTYNLWNRYAFKRGALKGLTLGAGLRHNDAASISADVNIAVINPAFTVFDAMASYKFKLMGRDVTAQLNVKNISDKLYRDNADGYFGQARTFHLSLSTRL